MGENIRYYSQIAQSGRAGDCGLRWLRRANPNHLVGGSNPSLGAMIKLCEVEIEDLLRCHNNISVIGVTGKRGIIESVSPCRDDYTIVIRWEDGLESAVFHCWDQVRVES